MSVNIKPTDNQIVWVPPQSDTDARVPTAEELRANSELSQRSLALIASRERPAGLLNRPQFGATETGIGVILPQGLHAYAPGHPRLAPLPSSVTVVLPGLGDTTSSVSRYDRLYLAVFEVVVGADADPDIRFAFRWRDQNNNIQTLEKENTRRSRTAWAVVYAQDSTTAEAVLAQLPVVDGQRGLPAINKSSAGMALGHLRLYPLDPNLVADKIYEINPDSLVLVELVRVWRAQNYIQEGYLWGRGGEKPLDPVFHLQPSYRYVGSGYEDLEARGRETFQRLMLGLPLTDSPAYDRAVVNLTNAAVTNNADAPGVACASPNGSVGLANGQRISFSNQAVVQSTFVHPLVTNNVGGAARAQLTFSGNAPAGSRFSPQMDQYRVYTEAGQEISQYGTFSGLGESGALTWTANAGAPVTPGQKVYLVPTLLYPAGSGFPVAGRVEAVYLNGIRLHANNVREASENDLTAYTDPANNEQFIVVVGRERAALHYIYKKISLTADAQGVVRIPDVERGCIAFLSGANAPTGRINLPVVTGLQANQEYNALVYYPPRPDEAWQFQIRAARYPGRRDAAWLEGSQVVTVPLTIAHTQGGGTSVYQSEGSLRYEAVAMRLPSNNHPSARRAYELDSKIRFLDEADPGPLALREVSDGAARGYARLVPGGKLSLSNVGTPQPRSLSGRLLIDSVPVGALKRPLQSRLPYQLVTACVVSRGSDARLLVVTYTDGDPQAVSALACDSAPPHCAAYDVFPLY